jgi:hypothetical protein
MENRNFKYDVAFSFMASDEEFASKINDLLQDRLETFIYSKKQEELAGTDGEEAFNRVFGSEARIVFVLYRKGWGMTPWTRFEETAIRNRAYEEGYDFVIFAPLDNPPNTPNWLPKNRIWVGLDRWGIEGAASVIEARVQEAGGTAKEETVEDRARRLSREIAGIEKNQTFLRSEKGVQAANKEIISLFSELKRVVDAISDSELAVKLKIDVGNRDCAIYGGRFCVYLNWSVSYVNTLDSSALYLSLWDGPVPIRGKNFFPLDKPKRIKETELQFDLTLAGTPSWREVRGQKRSFSTQDLAKFAMTLLLDRIRDSKLPKR